MSQYESLRIAYISKVQNLSRLTYDKLTLPNSYTGGGTMEDSSSPPEWTNLAFRDWPLQRFGALKAQRAEFRSGRTRATRSKSFGNGSVVEELSLKVLRMDLENIMADEACVRTITNLLRTTVRRAFTNQFLIFSQVADIKEWWTSVSVSNRIPLDASAFMESSKSQSLAVERFASVQWQLHHFPCDEESTYPHISPQFENHVSETFRRLVNPSHRKARNAETPVRRSISIAAHSTVGVSDGLPEWFGAAFAVAEKSAALPNTTVSPLSHEALAQHNSRLSSTRIMPPLNTPSSTLSSLPDEFRDDEQPMADVQAKPPPVITKPHPSSEMLAGQINDPALDPAPHEPSSTARIEEVIPPREPPCSPASSALSSLPEEYGEDFQPTFSSTARLAAASSPGNRPAAPVTADAGATIALPELPQNLSAPSALSSSPHELGNADLSVPIHTLADKPLNRSNSRSSKVAATKKRRAGSGRTKSKVKLSRKLQETSPPQRRLRSAATHVQPYVVHTEVVESSSARPIGDGIPAKSSRNPKTRKHNGSRPIRVPLSDEGLDPTPLGPIEKSAVLGTPAAPMDINPSSPTILETAPRQSHPSVFGQTLGLVMLPLTPDALL